MTYRATWLALAAVVMLNTQSAQAVTTTYVVDRTVGTAGRLTGTIATDGTIGVLQPGNILDWNLTLNADSDASTVGYLRGPLSGGNSAWSSFPLSALSTAVSGQTNALLFNFGAATFQVSQIAAPGQAVVWQMQAGMPFQDELLRESSVAGQPVQAYQVHGAVSVVLGLASAVPEPATMLLAIMGGFGLAGFQVGRAKKARHAIERNTP